MRYTQLKARLEGMVKLTQDPDQAEEVRRRMQHIMHEIADMGKGNIYRVRVIKEVHTPSFQEGFIFLCNLEIGELQEFTETVLGFKYLDYEPIPIGTFISGKTP